MTPPMSTWWTAEEEKKLRWMRNRGLTHKHIAHTLGRSCSAVSNRATALGLTRAKPQAWPMPVARSVTVQLPDLARWYAVGWRVTSFDNAGVALYWPNQREPRWPEGIDAIPVISPDRDAVNAPASQYEVA